MQRQTIVPYALITVPRPSDREIYLKPRSMASHQRPRGEESTLSREREAISYE